MKKIRIVIPCYNEEKRFPSEDFLDFMQQTQADVSFCFVNDGSSDNTLELLHSMRAIYQDRITVLDLKKNVGKAEAVRLCLLANSGEEDIDFLAYLDADFATSPQELMRIYTKVIANSYIIMGIGSRWQHLGANIQRDTKRHYFGRIFATIASIILRLPIYDTQCGAKVIKREIVPEIFNTPFISRWLFDVEVLARIIRYYGLEDVKNRIIEVPLNEWLEKGNSKIKLKDMIFIPNELFKIYKKYRS